MDSSEATKIVFSRIQSLDPENATKIMGYIFIQDNGEEEMIRLAFGPETVLLSLINLAKTRLGLLSNTSSTTPTTPSSPSLYNPSIPNPFRQSSPRIIIPNNGFHMNPSSPSGFSDHRSPRPASASSLSYAAVVNGNSNGVPGSFSPPTRSSFSVPQFYGDSNCSNVNDEYTLHDQLSFLDESSNNSDFVDPTMSAGDRSDSILFPYGMDPGNSGDNRHHFRRRSYSVSDVLLGGGGSDYRGTPCVYFDRGFCQNGNRCKFLHSGVADSPESKLNGFDELLRLKAIQQQRFAAASQLMAGGPVPYNKSMNFMHDSQRSASSASLVMGEEFYKFGRCLSERSHFSSVMGLEGSADSVSRQIYLTFPADSTFLEEDVSNYFSKFGPVQDVRIPFQPKRMFGFVSFVYPDTVKIILAKGNPHFICDSRVLVKPYKEKGKVPDKNQRHRQLERGGSFDSLEPYDLPVGPRMFLNSKEMLRRKLEQVELQHAIELQGRRMTNFQLSELKNNHHDHQFQPNHIPGIPSSSPAQPYLHIPESHLLHSNSVKQENLEENNSTSAPANSPTATADQKQEIKETCNNCNGNEYGDSNDSLEHILPDSLFASPTKSAGDHGSVFSTSSAEADDSTSVATTSSPNNSPTLPDTSTLNMTSLKSFYP